MIRNEKGQISLFFATTLFVLMSFLAFVINIGIFVKVKINLQNAVDAAAFSGASVQARQLTNISHLNWEMRNVYKEWLFKYYVLGNLNIADVENPPSGDTAKFNMRTYGGGSASTIRDRYNVPSVCIDFAGQGTTALCKNYLIPGLPRFNPINVGSLDQTTNSILDSLTTEKNKDCALRSQVNFLTTTLWAYNVKSPGTDKNALQTLAPEIGSDEPGAFPTAFELALRMRSLEYHVNEPPISGVCLSPNSTSSSIGCSQSINSLLDGAAPGKERITKAFFSGVRNLGGSEQDASEELRSSFTLTEIPPTPYFNDKPNSLSNLLIPQTASFARQKYYLDLKLITLNLATFYTIFTSLKDDITFNGTTVDTEAACASTKTGLPVPGYPLGFIKNPDVLTYYAVEGKAKFVGMFNPFDDGDGIKISAYAAAKPFGGRVGPMVFDVKDSAGGGLGIKARTDAGGSNKRLSSAFLTGMDSSRFVDRNGNTLAPGEYSPGAPLPVDPAGSKFWQSDETAIVGGWSNDPNKVVFAIPNMVYDYPDSGLSGGAYFAGDNIEVVDPSNPGQEINSGLYNAQMFAKLRGNLTAGAVGAIDPTLISNAIKKVRAPTRWDANNFLVPTTEAINSTVGGSGTDSFGLVGRGVSPSLDLGDYSVYPMQLYAPLYGRPQALLGNPSEVKNVLDAYLLNQKQAVEKYLKSMNSAASSIYINNSSGGTGNNLGKPAAELISDILESQLADPVAAQSSGAAPTCASIAGKFMYFYFGPDAVSMGLLRDATGCVPAGVVQQDSYLSGMLQKHFAQNLDGNFHRTTLTLPKSDPRYLFTAYRPGPQNDASANGTWENNLRGNSEVMIRNFYSSKFITLKSLTSGSSTTFQESNGGVPIHSEGNPRPQPGSATSQTSFLNPLDFRALNLDIGDISH